jgi:hypothetical protein
MDGWRRTRRGRRERRRLGKGFGGSSYWLRDLEGLSSRAGGNGYVEDVGMGEGMSESDEVADGKFGLAMGILALVEVVLLAVHPRFHLEKPVREAATAAAYTPADSVMAYREQ